MSVALVLTPEELEAAITRAVEPLRLELERLRGERTPLLVSIPEAARRLGVTQRTVQRWVKTDRIEVEEVGGARLVRLPSGVAPR